MKTRFIGVALAAGLAMGSMARAGEENAYPFFPFCIDWHDAKHRSFDQQAVMLKELGYDGVGHIWLDGVAQRLKTARRRRPEVVSDHHDGGYRPGQAGLRSAVQGRAGPGERTPRAVPAVGQRREAVGRVGRSRTRWRCSARCRTWPATPAPSCCSTRTSATGSSGSRTRPRGGEGRSAERGRDVQSVPLAAGGQAARLPAALAAGHAAVVGGLDQRGRRAGRQARLGPLHPAAGQGLLRRGRPARGRSRSWATRVPSACNASASAATPASTSPARWRPGRS